MQYGIINLSQHLLRPQFGAWQLQAITWTNITMNLLASIQVQFHMKFSQYSHKFTTRYAWTIWC